MATQAKITSVEAIELFRAALIVFTSQARPALEEVSSEVTAARGSGWKTTSAGFGKTSGVSGARSWSRRSRNCSPRGFPISRNPLRCANDAVNRAQRAVRDAEEKLVRLKKWDRELENRARRCSRNRAIAQFFDLGNAQGRRVSVAGGEVAGRLCRGRRGRKTGGENA